MKILKGKYEGRIGRVHQFANNWMMVDLDGGPRGVIVKPNQVQLDPDERADVIDHVGTGTFWQDWNLADDSTFVRAKQHERAAAAAEDTSKETK